MSDLRSGDSGSSRPPHGPEAAGEPRKPSSAPAAATDADEEEELDDAPRNPFDNPLFLPILLFALSIWFCYDGWFNDDPEMQKHLTFNRVGFVILIVLGSYYAWRARQEIRARKEQSPTA